MRLIVHRGGGALPPGQSGVSRLVKHGGLAQGTSQRVLDEESHLLLDTLDSLAKGFRLEAWQLLVPGMDPSRPPMLSAPGSTGIFSRELMERFGKLSADEMRRVENLVRAHLEMDPLPRSANDKAA